MHAVDAALCRADGARQYVRDSAHPRQRHVQIDHVQRREAEGVVAVRPQGHAPRLGAGMPALPDRGHLGDGRIADAYVVGEQRAEVPGEFTDTLLRQPLLAAVPGGDVHGRAGLGALLLGEPAHGVRTVVTGPPLHGRRGGMEGGARYDADLLGDDEAREQPYAELTEELRHVPASSPPRLELRPMVASSECTSASVRPIPVSSTRRLPSCAYSRTLAGASGCAGAPGGDRIHTVLQQLAEVDLRAGVEMVRQEVDQPPEVDLERVRYLLVSHRRKS